jgi:single-strand DNA-binding protein
VNEIPVTLVGNVVTDVSGTTVASGSELAWFRMASTSRRYDRALGRWVDGETSYVRVSCWRQLARNVVASLTKGDPVVVTGRLRVRQWERDDRRGIQVEVDASAVGHDLSRGVSAFTRPARAAVIPEGAERAALDAAAPGWSETEGASRPGAGGSTPTSDASAA